jgi:ribosomal protein L35
MKKTNKTIAKRVRATATGKLIKRKAGQDHFNSRESSKVTRNKRSDLGVYSTFARSMKKLISK